MGEIPSGLLWKFRVISAYQNGSSATCAARYDFIPYVSLTQQHGDFSFDLIFLFFLLLFFFVPFVSLAQGDAAKKTQALLCLVTREHLSSVQKTKQSETELKTVKQMPNRILMTSDSSAVMPSDCLSLCLCFAHKVAYYCSEL